MLGHSYRQNLRAECDHRASHSAAKMVAAFVGLEFGFALR